MGDYNYLPGSGQNPIEGIQQTLTNLMMMKQQQEQQEKVRQQEEKAQLNRLKMQHDLQKQLYTFQTEQEREARKNQFQDTIAQTMGQFQQAKPSLEKAFTDQNFVGPMPDGQPPMVPGGQEAMGLAEYGATMGQPVTGQQLFSNLNRAQGYQVNPEDMLKYQQAIESRKIGADASRYGSDVRADTSRYVGARNNETKLTIADMNNQVAMARIKNNREIADNNLALRKHLGELKAGSQGAKGKADLAVVRMIETTAKNITGGGEVSDEDRAEAIKQLSSIFPDTFGKYMQAVQEEPGLIYGTNTTLKSPSKSTSNPSADSVSGRFGF